MVANPPAPDDIRCEALVRGHKGWNPPHDKDHRCKRPANQMRWLVSPSRSINVCFQHASSKTIEEWTRGV